MWLHEFDHLSITMLIQPHSDPAAPDPHLTWEEVEMSVNLCGFSLPAQLRRPKALLTRDTLAGRLQLQGPMSKTFAFPFTEWAFRKHIDCAPCLPRCLELFAPPKSPSQPRDVRDCTLHEASLDNLRHNRCLLRKSRSYKRRKRTWQRSLWDIQRPRQREDMPHRSCMHLNRAVR
jgi:hypothetical protein